MKLGIVELRVAAQAHGSVGDNCLPAELSSLQKKAVYPRRMAEEHSRISWIDSLCYFACRSRQAVSQRVGLAGDFYCEHLDFFRGVAWVAENVIRQG